jgi:hypothetical protein
MAPDAIGAGTIKRLSELLTGGSDAQRVSRPRGGIALDTSCARCAAERAERGAQPSARKVDIERVRQLLRAEPGLTRSARSVAIFSSAEAGLLEAVGLPSSVESIVVLDIMAWLEPLADMISFENRGVVILSSITARLFRGGPSALTEFATFDRTFCNERPGRGFDSPSLSANEDRSASYVGRVAEQLLRAHRRHSTTW